MFETVANKYLSTFLNKDQTAIYKDLLANDKHIYGLTLPITKSTNL